MSSNSLRSHRVVVASLFLPCTAVIGDSRPSTPARNASANELSVSEVMKRLQQEPGKQLKSIVDDLKDRTRNPVRAAATPGGVDSTMQDVMNPFAAVKGALSPFTVSPTPTGTNPQFSVTPVSPKPATRSPTTNGTNGAPLNGSLAADLHGARPSLLRRQSRSSQRGSRRRSSSMSSPKERSPIGTPREEPYYIEHNSHCNGGLKNAMDSVCDSSDPATPPRIRKKLWVGTLGMQHQDKMSPSLKSSIAARMRSSYESEVIMLDDRLFERCYDGFCHKVLWPALHYLVSDGPKSNFSAHYTYQEQSFEDYVKVNQMFADAIVNVVREGDIVWVNDYHLMLVPAMLRASGRFPKGVGIGFFMHAAFPSSEIFRCLSQRESLLRGMLGADLIGFQTTNFARHFRQTVSRILAVEALPRGIQLESDYDVQSPVTSPSVLVSPRQEWRKQLGNGHDGHAGGEGQLGKGRFVDVGVFPMGIDVVQLKAKGRDPEVAEWVAILRQRYAGMKLLVGRDKMDEIQGVTQKIKAFEYFLETHPEHHGKVVLLQIALQPSAPDWNGQTNTTPSHGDLSAMIMSAISHINSRFSTLTYTPVVFLHTQDVSFSQYLALLTVADAFIVTSLREGMALRAHEYVIMQGQAEHRKGGLVLSEFTGSYSYTGFRSCIAINPYDTRGTAEGINQALSMPDSEAETRWEELHNHVVTQSAQAFVTGFLTRCLRTVAEQTSARDGLYGAAAQVDDLHQSTGKMIGKWKHCGRRLIFVDWEGTLSLGYTSDTGIEQTRVEREEQGLKLLESLAKSRKNEVWVLSGHSRTALAKMASRVKNIGIVAENGCFVRPRPRAGLESDWVSMVSNWNMNWKSPCLEILNYFTERTPGSLVEEREASMVWRFWTGSPADVDNPDRIWARRQAAEAQNHIFDSLGERYGLRIVPGANSFLVLPGNISRSTAVGSALRSLESEVLLSPPTLSREGFSYPFSSDGSPSRGDGGEIDIILAISADEKLLRRLNDIDTAETCSTSGKGTDAKWILNRADVASVLGKLAEVV